MKKAQISVYVIIGLVALATVITAFYAKEYVSEKIFKKNIETSIIVPEKIKPINTFVLSCLKETGERGLKLLGQQGGYTSIPNDLIPGLNLRSNSLAIFGDNNVAYWFYEHPNKVQVTKVPTKKEMESQLSLFIENNMFDCLNSFKDLPEFEIKQGDLKALTVLNKDNAVFSLNFPLNIKLKGLSFNLNKFVQEVKTPILDLYESSISIFGELNSDYSLEHRTIAMLVSYEEIPFSGTTDKCIPDFWLINNIEAKLKEIISNNIQTLKIKNTNYELSTPENEYKLIDANLKDKNLDVNFLYSESWPIELDINPKEGGFLKSQSVTEPLGPLRGVAESFVCLNTYHFIYNIRYPVLVILNKDNYVFQFALQVVINNNEPRKRTVFTNSIEDIDSRLCDTRNKELTVFTRDINNNPLSDVDIKYKCISNICNIGKTKLNILNEAVITQKYPPCLNGAVIASKEDYHFSRLTISSLESAVTTLFLEPYKDLNVEVQIERAGSGQLEKEEQVYIQLIEEEKDHQLTIVYPDIKKIRLIPGKYKVIAYLISNYPKGLDISAQEIETCFSVPKQGVISGLLQQTEKKCVKTKIPGTTIDKLISGFTEFDFEISQSDLEKNKIKFHVPYVGLPTKVSDITKAFESKNVPKPEFK